MSTPTNLRDQLLRDEAKRCWLYDDATGERLPPLASGGHRSVGIGRNVDAVPFRDSEIVLMLDNDIADRCAALSAFYWYNGLDGIRQATIVNMSFNLGLHGLLNFPRMIAALIAKDWATAAKECDDPHWHADVGDRATRCAQQVLTGVWV